MPVEVLILLRQALQDPSSGAARYLHLLGALLTRARRSDGKAAYNIRFIGTTATENGGLQPDAAAFLRRNGLFPVAEERPYGRVLHFQDHGIDCTLLDCGGEPEFLQANTQAALDALLAEALAERPPAIAVTYGGLRYDHARRRLIRETGATVVFALLNWGYLAAPPDFFSPAWGIDAVLAVSDFLRRRYREKISLPDCTEVLPCQMTEDTVVALERAEPGAVVFVNPTGEKGVLVFVRLADELRRRRPDIPLVVVESRGKAASLYAAAHAAGIDLHGHPNLRVLPCQPLPRDIFAHTKILLVPSMWLEPCGRLVAEALLNGIPPLVSDRGGLPDECRGAGVILPLPAYLQPESFLPPSVADIEPWIAAILRLWDSPEAYAAASAAAREAAQACLPEVVQVQCEALFAQLAMLRQKP